METTVPRRDQGSGVSLKSVAVFGAGVAGLTAAHELVRRGFNVSVYEAGAEAGGFFRSARVAGGLASEYSWHGLGPWYHNTFDVMKATPFDETASVYDKGLSRPIDFGIAPDAGQARFDDGRIPRVFRMLRLSGLDGLRWTWLLLKTWCAGRRSTECYSRINAADAWKPLLSDLGWRTWRATFGPWIGSDWTRASLHTTGDFFLKLICTRPWHEHPADEEGPSWKHGSRDGWLLLRGPSNECWLDRWVRHLERSGVRFYCNEPLRELGFDGTRIREAVLGSGSKIRADFFVLAVNPFAAAEVLARTPALESLDQLRLFKPLVQDGPHTQVSFRLAFSRRIAWPRKRTALVLADSEFNLTLFAQEQAWRPGEALGAGVRSLWTATACVDSVPGRVHKLPVLRCTKEQFLEDALAQIFACESLDALIREANGGRGLRDFPIERIEVWPEWRFSPEGIGCRQPKWVTTTNTRPFRPGQATPVPNLVLAGAHTMTEADVWSIEGAVESGRRAAKLLDPSVTVLPQFKPVTLRALARCDDLCYALGMPHFLDLLLAGVSVWLILSTLRLLFRTP